MTLKQINARDIIIEVESATVDTWTPVNPKGITGVVPNPSENEEVEPTTTYGSQGNHEQQVMQRGATLAITGKLLKDDVTGEPDPGQARLEVLGAAVGASSLGRVRFRYPIDTSWKVWVCTVTLGEGGGETNNTSAWAVTLTRSGASTTEAVA